MVSVKVSQIPSQVTLFDFKTDGERNADNFMQIRIIVLDRK